MQKVSRLYETFQPNEYRLQIELDRTARSFSGTVGILGNHTGGGVLTLHAKELEIMKVSSNGTDVTTHTEDGDLLVLENETEAGPRHLTIQFRGKITDAMHGLYPCYFEVNGVKKELLATQFESHHAREVFPCIDEPEAKAVFNLALTTEREVTVLSNMPARTTMPEEDSVTTVFHPTPMMSPYLLAFVVGELQKKSATTKNGTEVNIYATHAQPTESLDFGLQTAVKSIEFFNDYFGIPYPLPKCDHVALPDFSSGAMENWGLITYREVALLADANTAISSRQMIATVIAHETSHQWFGNLVTMKWWDDLWLNESFATLMEYLAVDAIYPKWNIWMTFASQETLSALRRDYLEGVQSVKTDVNHPDEISSLFDPSIVYAKGARLLKMLHSYIGEDAFRTGLKQYFHDHAYKNTKGSDLWDAFSATSGEDIGAFMTNWLEKPGYPLVTVAEHPEGYVMSQERFVIEGLADTSLWPIPLGHGRDDLPAVLDQRSMIAKSAHDALRLNRGNSAHFVTDYSKSLLDAIKQSLVKGEVGTTDRLALLHETSLLARAGKTSAKDLLEILMSYRTETEEPVWDIMSLVIADIKKFTDGHDEAETRLKARIVTLVMSQYERLGWNERADEPEADTKLRATVLGLLTYCEYEPVISEGLSVFRGTTMLETLNGEMRGVIFGIAGKCGTTDDWERLYQLYVSSQIADLKNDALAAFTLTKDPVLIKRMQDAITDESVVRAQDVDHWFVFLIRSRYSRESTWEWMVSHWGWIEKKFESDKSYDSFPRYAASALSTYEWKEKFDTFFDPLRSQPALTRAIELGSKDISGRAAWIERDQQELLEAL